jgi:spore germination protein KC
MNRIISIFFIVFLLITILAGCWSSKELNELSIVTALGIDKTEKGYLLSVQIINPGEITGKSISGRTEVVSFMRSGDTIFEAIRKLSTATPRQIYVSHLRVVVFGEKLARDGIGKALDLLSRDHEMRSDFYMTVAKGSTASDILKVITHQEKLPANKLFNALDNSEKKWGPTTTVTLDELINNLVIKGKEPILTGIKVYGNPENGSAFRNVETVSPKTTLGIDSLGVFKKDKLIGWLNEDESKGFNYIINNVSSTVVNVPCEDGKLSIETVRSQTKVKGKMEKGKPKINISVFSEGNVGDVECKIDLSKPENIKKLEEKYQNSIKEKITAAIKKAQGDYQSDIFGFGEVIHRADPKAWKRLEPNWKQEFKNVKVSVNVNAKIRRLGTITKSFQKEIEE